MSKQKGLQSQRWTDDEEKLLVSAWINASEDPIVGTSQKQDSFLRKIAVYFNEYCSADRKRDKDALNKKWKKMSGNIMTFAGCYDRQKDKPVSGFTEQDYMNEALAEYKAACNGNDFKHLSSWEVLRNHPKWRELRKDSEKGKRGRSNSVDVQESNTETTVEVRPIGQKAAKRQQKEVGNKVSTSSKLELFEKYQEKVTTAIDKQNALMAEHNQLLKDQMVYQLLSLDTSKMTTQQLLLYDLQMQKMSSQVSSSMAPSNNSENFHSEQGDDDVNVVVDDWEGLDD